MCFASDEGAFVNLQLLVQLSEASKAAQGNIKDKGVEAGQDFVTHSAKHIETCIQDQGNGGDSMELAPLQNEMGARAHGGTSKLLGSEINAVKGYLKAAKHRRKVIQKEQSFPPAP